ncbi:MAG: hypothetical protein J0H34_20795 [Rhizobiales bacterium]|nr:hypothetical protein [Hyphomicrobiales bacterium]
MTHWRNLSPAEKRSAVKSRVLAGASYEVIAQELGAPNRNCIASVVTALRGHGELPPPPSKQQTGATGGAVVRAKAKARRDRAVAPLAVNIANKPECHVSDHGLTIDRSLAFDPLPGTEPIALAEFGPRTCKWPVDGIEGPGALFCGAEKEIDLSFCAYHRRLAYIPLPIRSKAADAAAERLS